MADEGGADKGEYIPEEINKAVEDAMMAVFQLKENESAPLSLIYQKDKVMTWSNQILDYTNRNLSKLQKPFKYIVTCFIQQNADLNFTMAMGAHCDSNTDGAQSVQKEINDIYIMVTVFGMLI